MESILRVVRDHPSYDPAHPKGLCNIPLDCEDPFHVQVELPRNTWPETYCLGEDTQDDPDDPAVLFQVEQDWNGAILAVRIVPNPQQSAARRRAVRTSRQRHSTRDYTHPLLIRPRNDEGRPRDLSRMFSHTSIRFMRRGAGGRYRPVEPDVNTQMAIVNGTLPLVVRVFPGEGRDWYARRPGRRTRRHDERDGWRNFDRPPRTRDQSRRSRS